MENLELLFNKLAKWRSVFAGWQLGTRLNTDPECQAVRDHREVTICLRAEVNALTAILIGSGLVSEETLQLHMAKEAEALDKKYEEKFPGFSTNQLGVKVDAEKARETTKNWRP